MIQVGQFNQLNVTKQVPFGVYLDGGDFGEILLPNKAVPQGTQVFDLLDVFIYFDSDDKIIATTACPRVRLDGCAFLKVVDVNRVGAFLDWGLDKDLLVPGPEQRRPMEKDKSYLVYVKLDNQGRLIASSKLDYFLDKTPVPYKPGEQVSLLIAENTPLGKKAIINDRHWGLIHKSDLLPTLGYGQKISGFIKTIRADDKIDIVLRKPGATNIRQLAQQILAELNQCSGFMPLHDKSSSAEIHRAFAVSKTSFKSAIGQLYKSGEITIATDGIRLRAKK